MKFNHFHDVKEYPKVTELVVFFLFIVSLIHAVACWKRQRKSFIAVWMAVFLVTLSVEMYSMTLPLSSQPMCCTKSIIMLSRCHSLWGTLRHIPFAYSAWAIGSHESYATFLPISFMACFLYLFYSLTFECFAISSNIIRYNHKIDILNATVFFRIPSLVVAFYIGASLSLSLWSWLRSKIHETTSAPDRATGAEIICSKTEYLVKGTIWIFNVFCNAVIVLLGGISTSIAMTHFHVATPNHSNTGSVSFGEPFLRQSKSNLNKAAPALILGVLIVYVSCFVFSSRQKQSRQSPDFILYLIPLTFYLFVNIMIFLRTFGLGLSAMHEDVTENSNSTYLELPDPARNFILINSCLALWTSYRGCSIQLPMRLAEGSFAMSEYTEEEQDSEDDDDLSGDIY